MSRTSPRSPVLISAGVGGTVGAAYAVTGSLVSLPMIVQYAVASLLVVWAPTSVLLSRRILINGAIGLGWYGALWWLPAWFGTLGRAGFFISVALAVTSYAVTARVLSGGRRGLIPRLRVVDVLIPLGGAAAAWLAWPFIVAAGRTEMMAVMMRGWDQAGHFSMVLQQRQVGALPPAASGFDDTDLFYAVYSQYLHSALNGLTEMRVGTSALDPGAELVGYGRSYALMFILLTMLVIAAIVQLPSLRRRLLLSTVLCVFATTVIVLGPGGSSLIRGHLNVVYGALCLTAAVLLLIAQPTLFRPPVAVAASGLAVAAAGSWPLLGPVGAIILIVAALSHRRWHRYLRRWWLSSIVIAAATLTSAVVILRTVALGNSGKTLNLPGDSVEAPLQMTLLLVAVALAACCWPLARRDARDGVLRRTRVHRWSIVLIVLGCAGFGIWQVTTADVLSYYFWKLTLGVQLILIGFIAAGAGRVASSVRVRRGAPSRVDRLLVAVAATVALATLYGFITPRSESLYGAVPTAVSLRNSLESDPYLTMAAERTTKAYEVAARYPKGTVTYYAVQPYDSSSVLNDHWVHALRGDWSVRSDKAAAVGIRVGSPKWWYDGPTPQKIAALIEKTLKVGGPDHLVIVAPGVLAKIRAAMPPQLRERVISW